MFYKTFNLNYVNKPLLVALGSTTKKSISSKEMNIYSWFGFWTHLFQICCKIAVKNIFISICTLQCFHALITSFPFCSPLHMHPSCKESSGPVSRTLCNWQMCVLLPETVRSPPLSALWEHKQGHCSFSGTIRSQWAQSCIFTLPVTRLLGMWGTISA